MSKIRQRLLNRDTHCHICGVELTETTLTLDHVVPVANGGTSRLENLRPACQRCNRWRDRTDLVYYKMFRHAVLTLGPSYVTRRQRNGFCGASERRNKSIFANV